MLAASNAGNTAFVVLVEAISIKTILAEIIARTIKASRLAKFIKLGHERTTILSSISFIMRIHLGDALLIYKFEAQKAKEALAVVIAHAVGLWTWDALSLKQIEAQNTGKAVIDCPETLIAEQSTPNASSSFVSGYF